jgi:hypothetical protein
MEEVDPHPSWVEMRRLSRKLFRATSRPRVRAEETPVGVRLRVAGLIDSREHAARLAAGKHLLETVLRRPLLIEPIEEGFSPPATDSLARRARLLKGAHV